MRTTIIPAQITTVEDTIAGSFTLKQILILICPVFFTAFIYAVLVPTMTLTAFKLFLIGLATITSIILVIRIKEKIVAEWLQIIFSYHRRPTYWVFNKNELDNRTIDLPKFTPAREKHHKIKFLPKSTKQTDLSIADLVYLEHAVNTKKIALNFEYKA